MRHRVRQPDEVVRAAGARPPAARRVPPVLDVALAELPRRRPQEVLAHQRRPRHRERHRVLELVAEPEGAAGLVVAGAGPHPAAEVLVEEPAVQEDVEGVVGRPDLHRAERLVPAAPHRLERGVRGLGAAVPPDQLADVRHVPPLAEEEHEAPGLARREDDATLERRAGIEPRPEARRRASPARAPPAARASRSGRGRRCGRRSPSGAPRSRGRRPRGPRTRGSRRSWRGPRRSPRPAPSRRAGSGRPAAVPGPTRRRRRRRGAAGRPLSLVSVRSESFTGSTASTKTSSAWRMPFAARAKRVTPAPWRITNRPLAPSRGSGPGVGDQASPVSSSRTRTASEVGSVTGSFANGREPVLAAVLGPGEGRARRGDDRPEGRARDDVGPGQRRLLVALEDDDVLAPAVGEAADPVRERERRHLGLGDRRERRAGPRGRREREGRRLGRERARVGRAGARAIPARRSGPRAPRRRGGGARPRPSGPRAGGTRRPAGASRSATARRRGGPRAGRAPRRGS